MHFQLKMVLHLSLLKTAQNHPMLIELKNGETYNGMLIACDSWMNVHLRDAICTSKVNILISKEKKGTLNSSMAPIALEPLY